MRTKKYVSGYGGVQWIPEQAIYGVVESSKPRPQRRPRIHKILPPIMHISCVVGYFSSLQEFPNNHAEAYYYL